ncbi:glycoside hydrolase family 3 N-terminal domain-containing protein [Streptomyces flavidovirens]|uniref:glycoside hydrolase family 3 N-terminal domain-containing protein n=1 Tax=Streptomyces flavidovirens TaxID=67298 RepID=UPI000423FE2D|nr:glycoside hydrolase family 3 N-terminal domain-containing protein [Streptomyces flavidovirens]
MLLPNRVQQPHARTEEMQPWLNWPSSAALGEKTAGDDSAPAPRGFAVRLTLGALGLHAAVMTPVVVTMALRIGEADPADKEKSLGLVLGIGGDAYQNGVLRGEWGFDEYIVSDWTAARDTAGCANGGTDVAMPGPNTVYGEKLAAAVREGLVAEETVDAMVRRVLLLAARVGILDGAPPAVPGDHLPDRLDGAAVSRTIARHSCVLLRNEPGPDARRPCR